MIQRVPGFKDKKATEQRAADLEREAEQVRSGYKPKEHEHLRQPLSKHLGDFGKSLAAKGSSDDYAKLTLGRIQQVFDACELRLWGDISATKIEECLATLTIKSKKKNPQADEGKGKRLSSQTQHYYSQAIKQFCRWMVRNGRAKESPVEHLATIKVIPTFERRAATPEELAKLLETTRAAGPHYGLTGNERAMLYRFAAETGLRANEIRSLRVANFNFDACSLTIVAGYTKNKDRCEIPLKKQTAEDLRRFMGDKLPTAPAFRLPSRCNMARMLEADLPRAGIPFVDELGRRFDFHALRHTFITSLRTVPTRVAQSLARHKSSRMTDRYTHVGLLDERAVIEGVLPDYSASKSQVEANATGTDDCTVDSEGDNKPNDKQIVTVSQVQQKQALVKKAEELKIRVSLVQDTLDPSSGWAVVLSDHDPGTSDQDRKRIVRLLIEDITLIKADQITANIRFKGGTTRTLTLPIPLSAWEERTTRPEVIRQIDQLLDTYTDAGVAAELNRHGRRSGMKLEFTRRIVAKLRRGYGLKCRYDRLRERGLYTASEMATELEVTPSTIKIWYAHGLLNGCEYNDKGERLYELPPENQRPKKQQGQTGRLSERRQYTPFTSHAANEVHHEA